MYKKLTTAVSLGVLMLLQLLVSSTAWAAQNPPSCSANNLNINIARSAVNVTNGSTVTFTITVTNSATTDSCYLIISTNGLVFTPPGGDGSASGTPTTLLAANFVITNGFGATYVIPSVVNITNGATTANAKVEDAGAVLEDNPIQNDPAAIIKTISLNVFRPSIVVTKSCVSTTNDTGSRVIINFSGSVTNTGDVMLTNVVVYDNQPVANTLVFGPTTLAAGASATFAASYTNSSNVCGPFSDTVTAFGTAPLSAATTVSNSASALCSISYTPCISVTKNCATAVVGAPQTISGIVTNCGDIALTNITVTDSVVGSITNIALLPRGTAVVYSKTVTAICGGNTNVVTASGFGLCGGSVSASATNTCVVTESPCIVVSKNCATAVVGQPQLISGAVTNCGNVTLTNISVVDNVVGSITNVTSLAPGAFFLYSKTVTATCGGNTNVVTASGTSTCGTAVTAYATNTCSSTENPCITVTKSCTHVLSGQTQTVSGTVTNCGNVTLTNITITDNILGLITNINSLAPNAGAAYSKSFTATNCGNNANYVVAAGSSICGTPVQKSATNSCIVDCPTPSICVTKEVACFLGTNAPILSSLKSQAVDEEFCDTFSKFAVGIVGDSQNPAFCYRITITNCGVVDLTNVTVIDNQYGDFTTNFFPAGPSTVFPVGGSLTYVYKAEVAQNLTNTVNTTAKSALDGQSTQASDSAAVEVVSAAVSCQKQYSIDGGPLTNNATLPDPNAHTIVWYVTVINPSSQVNLSDVTIADLSSNLGCAITLSPFALDAGSNVTVAICTNIVSCSNNVTGVANTISVTADSYTIGTNYLPVCAHDINGSNIVVNSTCDATILCPKDEGCRVTGGGRQDAPLVYPANVRYITHGGQLGAPVGNHVCLVTADFAMGNPCIHGRWQHVRHMQGGNMGNFHASLYDTLECACLDTNLTPVVFTVGNQTYTNLVYGPGTKVDGLCNPDDNASGPQPRPAPSNKIAFTGIGDYAETQGHRTPQSVLFRIDIEDRSEPGGSKPKGGKAPPDRNRTRIWILTQSEIQQLHGAGPDPYLLNFRNAISACNGIDVQDGASVANGAAAFGVRPPDIDDGGELSRGNYQLHPSINNCTP